MVRRLRTPPARYACCATAMLLAAVSAVAVSGGDTACLQARANDDSACSQAKADLTVHENMAMLQVLQRAGQAVSGAELGTQPAAKPRRKHTKIHKAWSLVRPLTRMVGFARAAYAKEQKQASLLDVSAKTKEATGVWVQANSSSGVQVHGYCEDFDSNKQYRKWACSSLMCSKGICSMATFGEDCCPYTCGLCSGLHIDCNKMPCSAGRQWPKATDGQVYINYEFQGVPANIVKIFKYAAKQWESKSCIRFTQSWTMPRILVSYTAGAGACTCLPVGFPGMGKETTMDVGCSNNMNDWGLITHELGHALGMNHIHKRPDVSAAYRGHGPFLRMFWQNINPAYRNQFEADASSYIGSTATGFAPYDFMSIMHYGPGSTSANGQPVYDTIGGPSTKSMGKFQQLTNGDWSKVNDLYQCSGSSTSGGSLDNSWWGPEATQPSQPSSECKDDASYADPEYGSACSAWSGYKCEKSQTWAKEDYSEELQRRCRLSCNACHLAAWNSCSDSATYKDPEYHSPCTAWAGFQCAPSGLWRGANFAAELKANCAASCGACKAGASQVSSEPVTVSLSGCQDNPSWRDPEFNTPCSAWEGYSCQPSSGWNGVDYSADMSQNCRKTCKLC